LVSRDQVLRANAIYLEMHWKWKEEIATEVYERRGESVATTTACVANRTLLSHRALFTNKSYFLSFPENLLYIKFVFLPRCVRLRHETSRIKSILKIT